MTARLHLRDATRASHEKTDAAFSALDLARIADYRVFLSSHLLAWRALEPAFADGLCDTLRPPAMTGLLAADLRALEASGPVCAPPLFAGDALGAAYVVAGSHFGKRVLSRRHARSEDPALSNARRYLSSPALARYWPVLLDALEHSSPARLDRLVQGARSAFDLFALCLTLAHEKECVHDHA